MNNLKDEYSKIEIDPEFKNQILKNIIDNRKKTKKRIWVPIASFSAVAVSIIAIFLGMNMNRSDIAQENDVTPQHFSKEYRMSGNGLEKFDLAFLKLENNETNMVYSPLSIKYALQMLSEASKGNTKTQIDDVIGDYVSKKYADSKNMSFANALIINELYKNNSIPQYEVTLKEKYNASVIYDSLNLPDAINSWVARKTLNQIDKIIDNVNNDDFTLINALAIDMNWKNAIVSENDYNVNYYFEHFSTQLNGTLSDYFYSSVAFNDKDVVTLPFRAVANKYDVIKTIGKDNLRKTIKDEYKKWLKENPNKPELILGDKKYDTIDDYIDGYINIVDKYYKDYSSSTDFMFYEDEIVKSFAKDLKTYNNTTLEYVAIQPKSIDLNAYIEECDAESLNKIINNLKKASYNNFLEGYINVVYGEAPIFNFNYNLSLKKDLQQLGISDVFSSEKADLSNMTNKSGTYIKDALHKANIEFSNEGIKAAAATAMPGGFGDDIDPVFEYFIDAPINEIDLTFDNPYLFLIRDKDTKEIWFVGTVYEPISVYLSND